MSRLTYKVNDHYYFDNLDDLIDASNKLGQLEDIEEELGIDLITLNKLRKADKIYVKFFDEIQEWNKTKIELRNCNIWYGYFAGKGYGLSQPLSNYGTGFALTREELENDINLH